MRGTKTLGEFFNQACTFISAGTTSQMLIDKHDEVVIKQDGSKAFIDVKRRGEHFPFKLHGNNSKSS